MQPQNLNVNINSDNSGVIAASLTNAIMTARLYNLQKNTGKTEEEVDKETLKLFSTIADSLSKKKS